MRYSVVSRGTFGVAGKGAAGESCLQYAEKSLVFWCLICVIEKGDTVMPILCLHHVHQVVKKDDMTEMLFLSNHFHTGLHVSVHFCSLEILVMRKN